jgi:hypothetical protein
LIEHDFGPAGGVDLGGGGELQVVGVAGLTGADVETYDLGGALFDATFAPADDLQLAGLGDVFGEACGAHTLPKGGVFDLEDGDIAIVIDPIESGGVLLRGSPFAYAAECLP